jgi:hypothetical protein
LNITNHESHSRTTYMQMRNKYKNIDKNTNFI